MTQPVTSLLSFRAVSKVYGKNSATMHALRDVSLNIERGEFVAIMGPSGSGKSTTLNILGGLDAPSSGQYLLQGVDVGSLNRNQQAHLRRRFLGFIFQGFNLLNRTTALENVELPLLYRNISARERRQAAKSALERVGLSGWEKHTPAELSGGQQQRVAIARAIVTQPTVLFADEPTGNLDSARSHEVMSLLQELNRDQGITVVMVTHETEMEAYARRSIHFLDGGITSETYRES